MSTSFGPQRQRHGVKKKLVEGAGGLLVGAALVVLMRTLVKGRHQQMPPHTSDHGNSDTNHEPKQQRPTASG